MYRKAEGRQGAVRRRLAHGRLFPNLFVSATTFMLRSMRHFGRFPFLRYVTGTPMCLFRPAGQGHGHATEILGVTPSFRTDASYLPHSLYGKCAWPFRPCMRGKRATGLERLAGTLLTGRPRTHPATAPLA